MPTAKQNADLDNAKADTRGKLFEHIQEALTEAADLTPQARAAVVKDLAEAFAWTVAPTQNHN